MSPSRRSHSTLIGVPFEGRFEVRFSRWQGHWRVDAWPRQPGLNPDGVNTESLRSVLDRLLASGWTRGEGDSSVGSLWVSGLLGSREVTLHVHLEACG